MKSNKVRALANIAFVVVILLLMGAFHLMNQAKPEQTAHWIVDPETGQSRMECK